MFLHTFHPSPIAFQFGPITIYWYGLLIVIAILIGLSLTLRLAQIYNVSKEKIWNLFFYLVIFGLIGARVFYIFYNFSYYWKDPLAIFRVWEGGLSIHGTIVGGIIVIWLYCYIVKKQKIKCQKANGFEQTSSRIVSKPLLRGVPKPLLRNEILAKERLSFWFLADLLAPALVLGQVIGRWGNYFNQELYGRPTDLPWSIPIDFFNRTETFASFGYFHPTFLYESIWCFIIFLILLFLHKQRIRGISKLSEIEEPKLIIKSGFIFLIYLILYSLGRFFIEFLRIDPQPVFFGLRLGQWLSLIAIAGTFVVMTKMTKVKLLNGWRRIVK